MSVQAIWSLNLHKSRCFTLQCIVYSIHKINVQLNSEAFGLISTQGNESFDVEANFQTLMNLGPVSIVILGLSRCSMVLTKMASGLSVVRYSPWGDSGGLIGSALPPLSACPLCTPVVVPLPLPICWGWGRGCCPKLFSIPGRWGQGIRAWLPPGVNDVTAVCCFTLFKKSCSICWNIVLSSFSFLHEVWAVPTPCSFSFPLLSCCWVSLWTVKKKKQREEKEKAARGKGQRGLCPFPLAPFSFLCIFWQCGQHAHRTLETAWCLK